MDSSMDRLRERLGGLNEEISTTDDTARRRELEAEREELRSRLHALLARDPEGRKMLQAQLASLRQEYDRIAAGRVKMNFASGQMGFGGGMEPRDVHFMRSEHDKRSKLPYLEQRIAELEELLKI